MISLTSVFCLTLRTCSIFFQSQGKPPQNQNRNRNAQMHPCIRFSLLCHFFWFFQCKANLISHFHQKPVQVWLLWAAVYKSPITFFISEQQIPEPKFQSSHSLLWLSSAVIHLQNCHVFFLETMSSFAMVTLPCSKSLLPCPVETPPHSFFSSPWMSHVSLPGVLSSSSSKHG